MWSVAQGSLQNGNMTSGAPTMNEEENAKGFKLEDWFAAGLSLALLALAAALLALGWV